MAPVVGTDRCCLSSNSRAGENDGIAPHDDWKILAAWPLRWRSSLAAPAVAQNTDAPVDVTAAPPPSAETIGPSQLRDFNLQGTVTRPADRPATTPAQPADTATAQPASGEAVPAEAAAPSAAPGRALAQRQSTRFHQRRLVIASGRHRPRTARLRRRCRLRSPPIRPRSPMLTDAGLSPPPSDSAAGPLSWPWIAALIALIGGGAFMAWSRRGRHRRHGDPGRMAFAGLAPDTSSPASPPPVRPRPDPRPVRRPAAIAPRPDPVPPTQRPVPSPAPKPPSDGMIVSTRLKPQLNVEFCRTEWWSPNRK